MLATEVGQYLHDQGLGVKDDEGATGNIFIDNKPDAPDELISVRTSSSPPAPFHSPYDYQNIQVIVRGTADPRSAETTAKAIYNKFHGLRNQRLVDAGSWIVTCSAMSLPVSLGKDANGRHEYSLNLQFYVHNPDRLN